MQEVIYTIPVNEAFDADTECPLCTMHEKINDDMLEFALGSSYMQDDIRMITNKVGFCGRHVKEMYEKGNRLGLALMLKTHADKVIEDTKKLQKKHGFVKKGIFSKKEENPLTDYFDKLECSCFICEKVNDRFKRYISTTVYLYGKEDEFKQKIRNCKGFCNEHYNALLKASSELTTEEAGNFVNDINTAYINGLERVRDDLSWFIDKFDYRYTDAPWKNSKDSLKRMILKQNSENVKD